MAELHWRIRSVEVTALSVGLSIASALLIGTMALLLIQGTQTRTILATPPKRATLGNVDLRLPDTARDLSMLQAQALFHATRQFYVAPPPSLVEPPPPRPDYALAGVMLVPRKATLAVLMHNQTHKALRVKTGDALEGWEVQSVAVGRVVLHYKNDQMELTSAVAQKLNNGIRRVALVRTPEQGALVAGMRVLSGTGVSGGTAASGVPTEARLYRPPPPR